jgi:hypothetical protein
VGKEARSLGNIFMFRESEKSLKETPGDSFFIYPCKPEKEIKGCSVTFSCFYKCEKEQILNSILFPQLES